MPNRCPRNTLWQITEIFPGFSAIAQFDHDIAGLLVGHDFRWFDQDVAHLGLGDDAFATALLRHVNQVEAGI